MALQGGIRVRIHSAPLRVLEAMIVVQQCGASRGYELSLPASGRVGS